MSWSYGTRYQGLPYTTTVATSSALLGAVALGLALVGGRRPSAASVGAQFVLFLWPTTYALAWLGESV